MSGVSRIPFLYTHTYEIPIRGLCKEKLTFPPLNSSLTISNSVYLSNQVIDKVSPVEYSVNCSKTIFVSAIEYCLPDESSIRITAPSVIGLIKVTVLFSDVNVKSIPNVFS